MKCPMMKIFDCKIASNDYADMSTRLSDLEDKSRFQDQANENLINKITELDIQIEQMSKELIRKQNAKVAAECLLEEMRIKVAAYKAVLEEQNEKVD